MVFNQFRTLLIVLLIVSLSSLLGCKNQRINRLYKEGYVLYNNNEVKEALKKYDRILRLNEHHYQSINYVGLCYNYLGKHEKALKYYKEYQKYDSTSGLANLNIGIAKMKLEQIAEAERHFKIAESKDGTSLDILYFNLGELHANYYKDYERAIFYYNKSVDLAPSFVEGHIQMGDTYINLKKWKEAIDCYIKACGLGINKAGIYNNLGYSYMKLQDFDKAIQAYETSMKLDPSDPSSSNNLGFCYMLKGDFNNAIEILESTNKKFDQNTWGYRNLGYTYMRMDQKVLACLNLSKTIEIGFLNKWNKEYLQELLDYCKE